MNPPSQRHPASRAMRAAAIARRQNTISRVIGMRIRQITPTELAAALGDLVHAPQVEAFRTELDDLDDARLFALWFHPDPGEDEAADR
jgi:hypothetical protein